LRREIVKILINVCFGGFGINRIGIEWLRARGYPPALAQPLLGEPWPDTDKLCEWEFPLRIDGQERAHPLVIECAETLGCAAISGEFAELKIVEIPDGVAWYIHEYDGTEQVYEQHRSWK
jgi:hypothetical protein